MAAGAKSEPRRSVYLFSDRITENRFVLSGPMLLA
jgi:hypothetical protein